LGGIRQSANAFGEVVKEADSKCNRRFDFDMLGRRLPVLWPLLSDVLPEMFAVEDDDMVEHLPPGAAHESLSHGVAVRALCRDPSPCVEYQGCVEGYPVIGCVRPGDPHAIPSFFADAVAKFFKQF